jgi:hypothetical protein
VPLNALLIAVEVEVLNCYIPHLTDVDFE